MSWVISRNKLRKSLFWGPESLWDGKVWIKEEKEIMNVIKSKEDLERLKKMGIDAWKEIEKRSWDKVTIQVVYPIKNYKLFVAGLYEEFLNDVVNWMKKNYRGIINISGCPIFYVGEKGVRMKRDWGRGIEVRMENMSRYTPSVYLLIDYGNILIRLEDWEKSRAHKFLDSFEKLLIQYSNHVKNWESGINEDIIQKL